MESSIPNDTTVAAAVNAPPPPITLYNAAGMTVQVPPDAVAYWLTQGFSQQLADLDGLLADAEAFTAAVIPAWCDYLVAVRAKGALDAAAQTTAHHALAVSAQAWNALHLALHNQFAPAETPAQPAPPAKQEG